MELNRTRAQRIIAAQTAQTDIVDEALTVVDLEIANLNDEVDALVKNTAKRDAAELAANLYWLAPVIQAVRLGLTTQQPLFVNGPVATPAAIRVGSDATISTAPASVDPILERLSALSDKVSLPVAKIVENAENIQGSLVDAFDNPEERRAALTHIVRTATGEIELEIDGSLTLDKTVDQLEKDAAHDESMMERQKAEIASLNGQLEDAFGARNNAVQAQATAEDAKADMVSKSDHDAAVASAKDGLFTQSDIDQAVAEATQGMYSQEKFNRELFSIRGRRDHYASLLKELIETISVLTYDEASMKGRGILRQPEVTTHTVMTVDADKVVKNVDLHAKMIECVPALAEIISEPILAS